MKQLLPIAAIAAVLGLAGCATTEAPRTEADAKQSKEVVTGTRVPRTVAQPVRSIGPEAWRQETKSGIADQGRGS